MNKQQAIITMALSAAIGALSYPVIKNLKAQGKDFRSRQRRFDSDTVVEFEKAKDACAGRNYIHIS